MLAIATFKFQLVLGFIALLLLKRKWRELLGFASGSAVLVGFSVLMTGVPTLLRCPIFARQSEGGVPFRTVQDGVLARARVLAGAAPCISCCQNLATNDSIRGSAVAGRRHRILCSNPRGHAGELPFQPQDLSLFLIPVL